MSYAEFALGIFGGAARSLKVYFIDIRDDLQRANMSYTLDEYLSMALLTTAITFIVEVILLTFIFALVLPVGTPIYAAVLLAFTLSFGLGAGLFFLFYSYPATRSKSRRHNIKKTLPFAASYLATMASAKLPPITLFKTLAKFKEYGEISKEATNIIRDVEVFGMSFSTALKRQAKRTPSVEFGDFLWGINTVTSSGGNLVTYLTEKTEQFTNDYLRRIRKYAQDLSLYVEIYLTLIITGSIFFVVLSSIISTLSGGAGTIAVQSFVVFILLPLLSIGFILMVKSISPVE